MSNARHIRAPLGRERTLWFRGPLSDGWLRAGPNRPRCALPAWLALALVALAGVAGLPARPAVAPSATLRLAIGPFSAPAADEGLRQIGARLPDLLVVELSHQSRFQLVEREKVSAIMQELHLSAAGLTTPETVAQLGRVLACDWLVAGMLVPTGTRTQLCTKVIDVKSSVVLDLQVQPLEVNNLTATLRSVAAFLASAGSQNQQRQFIAFGRFTDLSISSMREDWAARLRGLLEEHFHAAGVGVVEREAVAPLLAESQFEQAGLTGGGTNRVKLQPAFWLVDGGCQWVRDTEDKVSVALRIQKMGQKEQVIRLTRPPGEELEKAVIAAIQNALADTNQVSAAQAAVGESGFHAERGMEGVSRRAPTTPSRFPVNADRQGTGMQARRNMMLGFGTPPDPERQRQLEENRRATLESFEKAILLNPANLQAKYMLGWGLMVGKDPVQRERGKGLLQEVAA